MLYRIRTYVLITISRYLFNFISLKVPTFKLKELNHETVTQDII